MTTTKQATNIQASALMRATNVVRCIALPPKYFGAAVNPGSPFVFTIDMISPGIVLSDSRHMLSKLQQVQQLLR